MELRNLYTFIRASELESFTKVADELGYAQSTITMQIKQLEEEIGKPLFDRIGKKVALTSVGQDILPYVNEILQYEKKIKAIGKTPHEVNGHIRIGVLESLFSYNFRNLLPIYHERYPKVTVEIKTASTSSLFEMLRQNTLDIIYVLDKKILDKDCICAYSNAEQVVFVGSPDNPITQKRHVPLAEVLQEPLIMIEKVGLYRKALEQEAAMQDLIVNPFMQIDNTAIITKLLRQGMGVSFLPVYVIYESVRHESLSIIDVDMNPVQFWSQLFYHKNSWVTPQMEGLIKVICENSNLL